ncbi:putative bifunctional diguanylate cyclase/phosphodiesterase [Reinekea blandensis]|uniref:Sensory box protein n=1 Tax=Reinekea blandensis MED297 TaxID=314283 RepID=A4BGQ1_9GAMM|nr:GGDEF domain-containing protein [Reinekea blandensis]EAR08699.1 sensory box protein [Reinekea sp. MED297] [Reinekea blandensis MED297]
MDISDTAQFQAFIDAIPSPIALSDARRNVVMINTAFKQVFGYEMSDIPDLEQWYQQAYPDPAYRQTVESRWQHRMEDSIGKSKPFKPIELKVRCKSGETKAAKVSMTQLTQGDQTLNVVSFDDRLEQVYFHQRLWRQANFDGLTDLPNRQYFTERLHQEVLTSRRAQRAFALVLLNIDSFKSINENHGQSCGDALLVETSSRLQASVRNSDVVGRMSSDEFVILVRDIDPDKPDQLQTLAQKLASAIEAPFYIAQETLTITCSMGISIYPNDSDSPDILLSHANQALSRAKQTGRSAIHFFTQELHNEIQRTRYLKTAMQQALRDHSFEVFLQPIVRCSDSRCVKAEALARWRLPEEGFISPAEFIPIAEDNQFIHELGHQVFTKVTQMLNQLTKSVDPDFQISINKSGAQFVQGSLPTHRLWPMAMKNLRLHNQNLVIEITESVLLDTAEEVNNRINHFQKAGFQFAIDDFGTGYSSFAYLARFPASFLKIDRQFIQQIHSDQQMQVLCEAMIAMAHKMDMEVVAEGVETNEQFKLLNSLGCDYCQGFYFSKPLAFHEFEDWLEKSANKKNRA